MKTMTPNKEKIHHDWYIIDATDKVLGRMASQVAAILRGKNKPYYAPNLDTGDYIVITNAEKIVLSRNKELQKTYKRYSGYPDGQKVIPYARMKQEKPEEIIYHAVKGMLPKNILGRQMIKKLKVYAGNEHPHVAQKPKELSLRF
jgi:large subunit ribosomal protein L13